MSLNTWGSLNQDKAYAIDPKDMLKFNLGDFCLLILKSWLSGNMNYTKWYGLGWI